MCFAGFAIKSNLCDGSFAMRNSLQLLEYFWFAKQLGESPKTGMPLESIPHFNNQQSFQKQTIICISASFDVVILFQYSHADAA